MVGAVTCPATGSEIEASDLTVTDVPPMSLLAKDTEEPEVVASKVMFLAERSLPMVSTMPVSRAMNSRLFKTLPEGMKSRATVLFFALLETFALPRGVLTLTNRAFVLPMVTSPLLD